MKYVSQALPDYLVRWKTATKGPRYAFYHDAFTGYTFVLNTEDGALFEVGVDDKRNPFARQVPYLVLADDDIVDDEDDLDEDDEGTIA